MLRLSDPPAMIEFGHFSILPHRRQLLAEGRPIKLGGRAFDLLVALMTSRYPCFRVIGRPLGSYIYERRSENRPHRAALAA